jgi:hypothetical protein
MTWGRENSCPYQDSNYDPSVIQPIASSCTDRAIPAPTWCVSMFIIYLHTDFKCKVPVVHYLSSHQKLRKMFVRPPCWYFKFYKTLTLTVAYFIADILNIVALMLPPPYRFVQCDVLLLLSVGHYKVWHRGGPQQQRASWKPVNWFRSQKDGTCACAHIYTAWWSHMSTFFP